MRVTKTLLLLLPLLGACNLDFQLGDLADAGAGGSSNVPDAGADGSSNAPDAGSCDGGAPVLTLVGPALQEQQCGAPYADPGATATDACFGDLSSSITRTGEVNTSAPGSNTLTYHVTNPSGQSASPVSRTVNVSDTLPPTLVLNGPVVQSTECASPYVDPGATATDACFGDVTSRITRTGTVNTALPGSYPLTYNATDPAGQSATPVSRTVNVSDTLPPTLALNGPANVTMECGSAYTEPGASAIDACAGSLSAVPSGTLNPTVPGSYTLSYSAIDPSGNMATASRTVAVSDTLPPAITVLGSLNQTLECGSIYADPGATASDACAGDLTSAIQATRTGSASTPGTFTISYSVADPSGNSVTSPQRRTVSVNDTRPPTLVLNGSAVQSVECASPYVDPGAAATDACFGDVTSRITRTGTVNTAQPGSYPLTYNVTDPAGQSATPVSRTVNVKDSLPPTLVIIGSPNIVVECGSAYTEPGASAIDACAGDVSIMTSGTPDIGMPGGYLIRYSATDPSGNTTTISRTVSVVDTRPPVITVLGPLNVTLECGTTYTDPGATADDVCSGSLPVMATWTGTPNRPGTFAGVYSAADPSGNASTSSSQRTVVVFDTLAPAIQVLPGLSVIACNGTPYVDPGATATDACDGDVTQAITVTSNLDQTRAGDYQITYAVTDSSGNSSVATRPITVGPCSLCLHLKLGETALSVLTAPGGAPPEGDSATARFAELRNLSSQLSRLPVSGATALETPGELSLRGTNPELNVFQVDARDFTDVRRLSIDAPAGSLVVVNIHGESASFTRIGHDFHGGIDAHDVLYNFVEATDLRAEGSDFWGTLLAPYAHVEFNRGSWEGSLYAVSFTGDAEGQLSPLTERQLCP